jgi:uncharacterized protein (TIGR03435 family)
MTQRIAIIATIGAYAAIGQAASSTRFEIVSIKPNSEGGADAQGFGDIRMLPGGRMIAEKVLLRYFIQNAYGLKPFQLSGGPGWIDSAHYDIDAKAAGDANGAEMRLMMQALLEDRFRLKIHRETRELPVYELSAAKGGAKLLPPKDGSCVAANPNAPPAPPAQEQLGPCGRILVSMSPVGARLAGGNVSVAELVRILSNILGRTVVNKTAFSGTFDVHLEFAADEALAGTPRPPMQGPPQAADLALSSIFTVIHDQLGLKLESAKGGVEVIVIDHVEIPTEN